MRCRAGPCRPDKIFERGNRHTRAKLARGEKPGRGRERGKDSFGKVAWRGPQQQAALPYLAAGQNILDCLGSSDLRHMAGIEDEQILAARMAERLAQGVGFRRGLGKRAARMFGDEAEIVIDRSRQDGIPDETVDRGRNEGRKAAHDRLGARAATPGLAMEKNQRELCQRAGLPCERR